MGITTSVDHLSSGDRFLAQSWGGTREFFTVIDAGHKFSAVSPSGEKLYIKQYEGLKNEEGKGFYVNWADPFPNLPDDEILNYVDAILGTMRRSDSRDKLALLHVTEVIDDTSFRADFVYCTHREYHDYVDLDEQQKELGVELRRGEFGDTTILRQDIVFELGKPMPKLFLNRSEKAVEKGDLISTGGFMVYFDDGQLTYRLVNQFQIIASNLEDSHLNNYIPFEKTREPRKGIICHRQTSHINFYNDENFLEDYWHATIKLEPDEGLVFWCKDGSSDETTCLFLAHTGWVLHNAAHDCINDYFYGENVAMGLYLCSGPKWWAHTSYEGEHDAGIDCDFVPASLEDLERFGFDKNSVVDEIREYLDEIDFEYDDDTVAEKLIQMANDAAAKQKMEIQEAAETPVYPAF